MSELARRQRSALAVTLGFMVLDAVLLLIAYLGGTALQRPGDPSIKMGLWIAILVFGLGAFVVRRTKFALMRLKDIAAVMVISDLLRTLQGTTIQVASIGGAISLMGFMITIRSGDWTDMLRAAGVALIVLVYGYPFRSAWQRVVIQLNSEG
jgi:hypothetical protein